MDDAGYDRAGSDEATPQEVSADSVVDGPAVSYFELQAAWGLTRHLGGRAATRALAEQCDLGHGDRVLDVGCGVGATPAFLVEQYGCEVVGVDVSPKMAGWTRRRADRPDVAGAVEAVVGDATSLPFADGSFDAVVAESVTAFVDDPAAAFGEYARVARTGGRVGVNEATWDGTPDESTAAAFTRATGARPRTAQAWATLLADAGLADVATHRQELSALQELASEFRCYRPSELVRAWGRFFVLLATEPKVRSYARDVAGSLRELLPLMRYMDYGIYVGTKPE